MQAMSAARALAAFRSLIYIVLRYIGGVADAIRIRWHPEILTK
jgi:hypothetical protein